MMWHGSPQDPRIVQFMYVQFAHNVVQHNTPVIKQVSEAVWRDLCANYDKKIKSPSP